VSEQQNPLERAVDLLVFAPVGVAMFAKDTVPTFLKMFVSRGQTEIARQKKSLHDHANQYRTVGKFAVKYGGPVVKQQAEEKLDGARRIAEGLVPSVGGTAEPPQPPQMVKNITKRAAPQPAPKTAANGTTNGNDTNGKYAPAPHVPPALAIPGYDQLSASQVVERLEGLTPDELDAVREHELAHRGRNTILGKITQLTS
jgi:hypothetical protein